MLWCKMVQRKFKDSAALILAVNISCFGMVNTITTWRTFQLARNHIHSFGGSSGLVKESPDLSYCSQSCSTSSDCKSAVFDHKELKCYQYPGLALAKVDEDENTDFILLQDKASYDKLHSVSQECCYHMKPNGTEQVYTDCQEAFENGDIRDNDLYYLRPAGLSIILKATCQFDETHGWTVIQKRTNGSVDFYRDWYSYTVGFGYLDTDYWIGLEAIHHLTKTNRKLRVDLMDWDGGEASANYNLFYIDGQERSYKCHISGYSGTAGDSMGFMNGMSFTTFDQDNDSYGGNCAILYKGGWWYTVCHSSNLNGVYYSGGNNTAYAKGACWQTYKGYYYSMKTIHMKVTR